VGDSCNAGDGTTGDGHECKKKVLEGNVGSGAEELDRLIVDDQNQIDEGRMVSTRPYFQHMNKIIWPFDLPPRWKTYPTPKIPYIYARSTPWLMPTIKVN
jgi:hypothetical protein